jgi:hypothetical protein
VSHLIEEASPGCTLRRIGLIYAPPLTVAGRPIRGCCTTNSYISVEASITTVCRTYHPNVVWISDPKQD